MRAFVFLALVACGGNVPAPEYPSPPEEPESTTVCDPTAPVERTVLAMEPPGLIVQHETCDGNAGFGFSYQRGIIVGDTWLIQTDRIVEASTAETSRALPPVEEWVAQATDYELGMLQPLTDGWLYNPRSPAYPSTFVATDLNASPLLERIQAVYGEPTAPIFVVPSWDLEQGERPWMIVSFDEDPDLFGPALIRAYLGPGEPWLDGTAEFLWQVVKMKEDSLSMDHYLDDWLALYARHRQTLSGEPHRQSPLAAQVMAICQVRIHIDLVPHALEHQNADGDRAWMNERGVLDVRSCLASLGVELAAVRYEGASPDRLLRTHMADGDPPTITRAGSFFQPGDVVVEVNRRRIQTQGDIAWALRDVDSGDRFTIVVERDGQQARTWARRPRVGERNAVRFALIPVEADES